MSENAVQAALNNARQRVEQSKARVGVGADTLIALADVEVRAEQARQQEIANLIAMLAAPAACPYPGNVVRDRIKELVNLKN